MKPIFTPNFPEVVTSGKCHKKHTPKMQNEIYIIPHPEDIPISVFKDIRAECAHDYTLQQFINIVTGRTHNRYAPTIANLRNIDRATNEEQYKNIKKYQLCAFTPSCRCSPGESRTKHPETNNGVLCVDIDGKDNPHLQNWEMVRDTLGKIKYCYLSALSAGGKGVFLLFAVDPRSPHKQTFSALQRYFEQRFNIAIDKNCSEINRLRIITHDPNAVVSQPREIFKTISAPATQTSRSYIPSAYGTDEYSRVRAAARIWVQRRIGLESYDEWYRVGAALKELPDGEKLFDAVSQFGETYNPAEIEKKFSAVRNMNKIHVGTFLEICKRYGITNEDIAAELRGSTLPPHRETAARSATPDAPLRAAETTEQPPTDAPLQADPTPPPTTAAEQPPRRWEPESTPPYPIAPGETQEQARERNAEILNQAICAAELLKGVIRFRPPTPHEIEIMNPDIAPPQYAPF